jgi:hypothetical protein
MRAGAVFVVLGLWATTAVAAPRPLVSVLGTCAALGPNTYPLDTTAWFNPSVHSQVVFYAHLLFPLENAVYEWPGPWQVPLVWPERRKGRTAALEAVEDAHYVEAEWLDPGGRTVALYGMTLAARIRSDWLYVNGADYIPHTFAMAIGTRDLRRDAGQVLLPSEPGQYTVRFSVDHERLGLAFFRILARLNARSEALPVPSTSTAPAALGVSPSVLAR